ncbi:MAG: MraY family glycosyltransferase [Planctomycetota bacterium]
MTVVTALVFVGTLLVSTILVGLVRHVATRVDFVDRPAGRKAHARPVPYGGGVAIVLSVLAVMAVGMLMARGIGDELLPGTVRSFLETHRAGLVSRTGRLGMILGGGLVLAVMGLVDDARGMSAWLKLAVQVAVATGLAVAGVRITVFVQAPWVGGVLTVVWIVGIANAFNFLDNMDGLSAGVGLVVSVMLAVVAMMTGNLFIGLASLVLAGALAGFLLYNFHPASIFMGDTGSLFVGYLLAVLAVENTFYVEGATRWAVVVLPLALFAVPIYDVVVVTIIRLRRGQSPLQGDRSHFSHRLLDRGLSTVSSVLVIYLATVATASTAVVLVAGPQRGPILALLQTVSVVGLLLVLEHISRPGRGGG